MSDVDREDVDQKAAADNKPDEDKAAENAEPDSEPQDEPQDEAAENDVCALLRWPVYLMFFFSGAASLICQVAWFKQMQLVVGSSTYAVSVTVASYFLGLALGSWFGGKRLADRSARPLRLYAAL